MAISSSTAASVSSLVSSPQPQQVAPKNDTQPEKQIEKQAEKQPEKQPEKQQDSTVVKLSEHAQQMKNAENQNNNAGHGGNGPKEKTEPPGIRFMEGESKGGRVNTFA